MNDDGITSGMVLRRFVLWLTICGISAAPSFVVASMDGANQAGMACGVLFFVLAYTACTSTRRFQRFYSLPHIRQTLRFGYGIRLLASATAALSAFYPDAAIGLMLPDVYCGMLSVVAGTTLMGGTYQQMTRSFGGAMLITCIQGALLNTVVFVLMLCFYGIRRLSVGRKERRGFEVIVPSTRTNAQYPKAPG